MEFSAIYSVLLVLIRLANHSVRANPDAKMLYNDLLRKNGYNKLIRPVGNNSDTLTVKLGLKLSQLIDIDEKNQIMTTNVWLIQQWEDYMLQWDPRKYGGVKVLYVPAEEIWLPDIVLYNNADGNYQVTLMTKATVHHTGRVVWEPPAIYKSSCTIDVEFFPFDEQTCSMKFSSWTYDGYHVDLKHIDQADDVEGEVDIPRAINMADYYQSFVWEVMKVPARRNEVYYPCCPESYPDVTFHVQIRRKTLFYTVNLIIPCVAISFLTVLVFYLPSDSGEKITLCISILLSLTVFFLLLSDLIPPTSLVVPLIGKYLLFTMILVTLSIIITVVVLNVHYRSPTTHVMSPWVRKVFLHILPRLLMMKRPTLSHEKMVKKIRIPPPPMRRQANGFEGNKLRPGGSTINNNEIEALLHGQEQASHHPHHPHHHQGGMTVNGMSAREAIWARQQRVVYHPEIERAMDGVRFIADHLKEDDKEEQIKEDWKYVAMVIDRLFLWIFTTACVVGTFGIILQAPTLYDDRRPMEL